MFKGWTDKYLKHSIERDIYSIMQPGNFCWLERFHKMSILFRCDFYVHMCNSIYVFKNPKFLIINFKKFLNSKKVSFSFKIWLLTQPIFFQNAKVFCSVDSKQNLIWRNYILYLRVYHVLSKIERCFNFRRICAQYNIKVITIRSNFKRSGNEIIVIVILQQQMN